MITERPNETARTADFEFAGLREARNYRAALVKEFSSFLRGNVIEVGAGIGQITELVAKLPSVQTLLSIEPNPSFCEIFRSSFPEFKLIEGTIDQVPTDTAWQAILSVNVLEHIRDDESEIYSYHRLLQRDRGHLCIFVPARPEIFAPIDKDFGHHRRYTPGELRQKLQESGFIVERLKYANFVGYFAWWFAFRLLKKRRFDLNSILVFDRMIFPIMHAFESNIVSPPIGQSLVAVARALPLAETRRHGDGATRGRSE